MARYRHNLPQLSDKLFITDGGLEAREVLDDGNPEEFGRQYRALRDKLNHLNVLGGCCGTDHRHLEAICQAVLSLRGGHNKRLLFISTGIKTQIGSDRSEHARRIHRGTPRCKRWKTRSRSPASGSERR